MENKRIYLLDSFRAIAILLVVFFHYFSRWIPLYPYGDKYDFFPYGKLGVQFFFIISGFVILYTLDFTPNLSVFWKKRMLRLLPSMLIASTITFLVFILFDKGNLFPNSHSFTNIFVSCTFIQPDLLSSLTGRIFEFDYISGSYWSLWLEIQFYALASFIFYFNKKRFLLIFTIITFFLIVSQFILSHIYIENRLIHFLKVLYRTFSCISALPYFCIGVLFYILYKNKESNSETDLYLKLYAVFLIVFLVYDLQKEPLEILLILLFIFLFFILVYFSNVLSFLNKKIIIKIGVASYFLYLIHENIGVLLINKLGGYFSPIEFIWPLLIIATLCMISIFYTYKVEKKLNIFLKKYI